MNSSIKECIRNYTTALIENNAAIFAGAGLSKPAGFVDWKELMRDIAEELGLDVDRETDLIAIAQYHINDRLGNRSAINQLIIDQFTKKVNLSENHQILASLPISTYWTTNYDNLIETSLINAGKTPDVKRISENLLINIPKRDAVVYKMHGDITLPNEAVLTKEDYETYECTRQAYSIVLQSDLLSKTFLFIGFSFDDPNLIFILSRIKNLIGTKNVRTHYCVFKKESDTDKRIKQQLKLKDLARYGIKAVEIDDYSEITQTLINIKNNYKNSQIFISGAAEEFTEFKDERNSKKFIHDLSKFLVSKGLKIISGFGNNVGSGVINGALEYIFSTNYHNLDEYLKLRPFPQYFDDCTLPPDAIAALKNDRNKRYRELMISQAGIAVFMFGNKLKSGSIVNSNGMYEEFKISVDFGVKPIPIGATGYMAKVIWNEVMANFEHFYGSDDEIRNSMRLIGDPGTSQDEIISNIYNIIQKLNSDIEVH